MGLDNYIYAKANKDETSEEEICYWRKCWNIRNWIFEIIGSEDSETYEYPLSLDNVVDIYYMMKNISEKSWDEDRGSIWTYEEMKPAIKEDIKKLKKLIRRMKKDPNLYVSFVDSY